MIEVNKRKPNIQNQIWDNMFDDLLKGHLSMSNVDIKIMIIGCYSLSKPLLQMLNKKIPIGDISLVDKKQPTK